jgi:SAM-dependent methyltransferase
MTSTLYGPEFFAGRSGTVTLSAGAVVPVLSRLLSPGSVLDLGCGQGEWLEALGDVCKVGVDIAAPEGEEYLRHDLQLPLDLGRTFDLVICLEVGEHLPAAAADVLVDSATRHSTTIVFGAAVVGQEGIGHINCQPHEYWHEKFEARGYVVNDSIRPLIRNDHRVSPWYRDNMFLYVRAR